MARFSIRNGQTSSSLRTESLIFSVEDNRAPKGPHSGQNGFEFTLIMTDALRKSVPGIPFIYFDGENWKIAGLRSSDFYVNTDEMGTLMGHPRNFVFSSQLEAAKTLEENINRWMNPKSPTPDPDPDLPTLDLNWGEAIDYDERTILEGDGDETLTAIFEARREHHGGKLVCIQNGRPVSLGEFLGRRVSLNHQGKSHTGVLKTIARKKDWALVGINGGEKKFPLSETQFSAA